MKKRISILIFLAMTSGALAQKISVKEVLDKATDYYSNTNEYLVEMKFTMFRGLTGKNITESYTGTIQKTKTCTINSVFGVEVYQFPEAKLVIDPSEMKITYSKVEASNFSGPIEIGTLLKYYDKTKLNESGTEWICEMVPSQKTFNQLPYGKVELFINKNDFSVSKQILYFSSLIPFKSKNGNDMEQDYGRLVINMKNQPAKEDRKIELEDFIIKSVDGKLNLNEDYASYELVHQTDLK